MNFEFTEEHLSIKEAAKDFAENEIAPTQIERDIKSFRCFCRTELNNFPENYFCSGPHRKVIVNFWNDLGDTTAYSSAAEYGNV